MRALVLLSAVLLGTGTQAQAVPTTTDPWRPAIPGEEPWESVLRCSTVAVSQAWAGKDAVNCGNRGVNDRHFDVGPKCLQRAQELGLAAYLVVGSWGYARNKEGLTRQLHVGTDADGVAKFRGSAATRKTPVLLISGNACQRFIEAGPRAGPPGCQAPSTLRGLESTRVWSCDGAPDPLTLPPEWAQEALALGEVIPFGPELRHGGEVLDLRILPYLLSRGTWQVRTLDVGRSPAEREAHVHAHDELLLVHTGTVEVSLQGLPTFDLQAGAWAYLQANIPHRTRVLEPSRFTLHVQGADPGCPGLDSKHLEVGAIDPEPRRPDGSRAADKCLRAKVIAETWAGPSAIDCGLVGADGQGFRCAMWAQERGVPFFVLETREWMDSPPFQAYVRTLQGESFILDFEGIDSWRACGSFRGPSWRSAAPFQHWRSNGVECLPLVGDQRLIGNPEYWNCEMPGRPQGVSPAAHQAITVARALATEQERKASDQQTPFGLGRMEVQALRANATAICLAKGKTAGRELWFLAEPSGGSPAGKWVLIEPGMDRIPALGRATLVPGSGAIRYRPAGAPEGEPVLSDCAVQPPPTWSEPLLTAPRMAKSEKSLNNLHQWFEVAPWSGDTFKRSELASTLLLFGLCAEARAELKRVPALLTADGSTPLLLNLDSPAVCNGPTSE